MGTSVELPLTGDFDSTVVWEFTKQGETETTSVVVDGKWIDVDVDTIYEVLVTVTLGEAEREDVFEITVFVDGELIEELLYSYNFLDGGSSNNNKLCKYRAFNKC